MALTKTTIINLALSKLGSTRLNISDFDTDTTLAGEQARLHYDQALRELVRTHTWNCCLDLTELPKNELLINSTAFGVITLSVNTLANANVFPGYKFSGTSQYATMTYDASTTTWTYAESTDDTVYTTKATIVSAEKTPPKTGWTLTDSAFTLDYAKPLFRYEHQFALPTNLERVLFISNTSDTQTMTRYRCDYILEGRALLTNEEPIFAGYVKNPDPSDMDALFSKAFIQAMAVKLATPLTGSRDLETTLLEEYISVILPEARRVNGFEQSKLPFVDSEWIEATLVSASSLSSSYPPFSQSSYGSFS